MSERGLKEWNSDLHYRWKEERERSLEADIMEEGEALVSGLSVSLWATDLDKLNAAPVPHLEHWISHSAPFVSLPLTPDELYCVEVCSCSIL